MFENNLINQIRNNANVNVEEAEIALPQDVNFEVNGVQCTVGFVPSAKKPGKIFAVLTAVINGVKLCNRYTAKGTSDEEVENAKNILTRSVTAIQKILKYNVNVDQNEEGSIVAQFDWETYSAFKEECSFGDFLPEVPEENTSEEGNEDEAQSDDNSMLTCVINLKNADALEEYATLLEETWAETLEKFDKESLYNFTVSFGKEEVSYISATNIQQDGVFIYFEGNITSEDYARKVEDVKKINKSKIPSYEVEMLKKVIFA